MNLLRLVIEDEGGSIERTYTAPESFDFLWPTASSYIGEFTTLLEAKGFHPVTIVSALKFVAEQVNIRYVQQSKDYLEEEG